MSIVAPSLLCFGMSGVMIGLKRMTRDEPELSKFFEKMSIWLMFGGLFFLLFLL